MQRLQWLGVLARGYKEITWQKTRIPSYRRMMVAVLMAQKPNCLGRIDLSVRHMSYVSIDRPQCWVQPTPREATESFQI